MSRRRGLWVVTLESGESFTVEATSKGEAIEKACVFRGRTTRIAKVENVAEQLAAQKYNMP